MNCLYFFIYLNNYLSYKIVVNIYRIVLIIRYDDNNDKIYILQQFETILYDHIPYIIVKNDKDVSIITDN